MAKDEKKNGSAAVAEKPNTEVGAVATVSNEQVGEMLASAKLGDKDSGYLTFEPGVKHRLALKGWKPIPSKDTTQPAGTMVQAAVFITAEGKELINADSAIRSYFEKQPLGCAREVVCKGKNKGPKGEYKVFEFFELEMTTK